MVSVQVRILTLHASLLTWGSTCHNCNLIPVSVVSTTLQCDLQRTCMALIV